MQDKNNKLNKNNNKVIGALQEKIGIDFLIKNGYTIKACNYTKQFGEIDIIAQKFDYIYFIEVKYRKNLNNGYYPRETVTKSKQNKIKKTALAYIEENNIKNNIGFSFDVLEIIGKEINYIQNAFSF